MTKIFDVRDYGAVGDGVTDDAPAIGRACEAAAEWARTHSLDCHCAIYIPAGMTCFISTPARHAGHD